MEIKNLFRDFPANSKEEFFSDILKTGNLRVERIVSFNNSSPKGFWYDQEENELIFLIKGGAVIQFQEEDISLTEGDYIVIPAHTKHRVKSTQLNVPTIWITIYYS